MCHLCQRYDGDIDGFVAASETMYSPTVALIHQLIPGQIQVRGSKALADSWCIIQTRHANHAEDPEFDLITWLRIFSRCEKVKDSGEWKMLTLEPIYMRDLITPVPPGPMPDFGDNLSRFRKSYRFTGWCVSKRGLKVRDDMPGDDVLESVTEVCERNQAWFDAA